MGRGQDTYILRYRRTKLLQDQIGLVGRLGKNMSHIIYGLTSWTYEFGEAGINKKHEIII